jgi:hypothetical protein
MTSATTTSASNIYQVQQLFIANACETWHFKLQIAEKITKTPRAMIWHLSKGAMELPPSNQPNFSFYTIKKFNK